MVVQWERQVLLPGMLELLGKYKGKKRTSLTASQCTQNIIQNGQ